MRIRKFDLLPAAFPLTVPFTTALHSVEVKHCVMLRLESDEGLVGWGEAAPEVQITGDDHTDAYRILNDEIRDLILNQRIGDEDGLKVCLEELSEYIGKSATAVAAADIALHDLWTRYTEVLLCEYFGGNPEPIGTSISIGMMEPAQLMARIQAVIDTGARTIKLKIGRGVKKDLELIDTVRDRFGDGITIRLDANQAYGKNDALALLEGLYRYGIEFVEQPVPARDLDGLRAVCKNSPVPVMADETAGSFFDVERIVNEDVCSMVNLKLMKSGGLYQVDRTLRLCIDSGISCMIGCMIETPVGISAGVGLAQQGDPVRWTDLDGHLFLGEIDDTFSGLHTEGDRNIIKGDRGLGIKVAHAGLKRFISDNVRIED